MKEANEALKMRRNLKFSAAILLILGLTLPIAYGRRPSELRAEKLESFRKGTLQEFLSDHERRYSFQTAELACVSGASDLPAPFKGDREGREYYLLKAKKGRYVGLAIILEIKGRHEIAIDVMKGTVSARSPFLRALRSGVGAERFVILRRVVLRDL